MASTLHSSYLEVLSSGHKVWTMHEPDGLSEDIVNEERQRSYLSVGIVNCPAQSRNQPAPVENAIFDELYSLHHVRIRDWSYWRFPKLETIEDAIQEAWLKVYQTVKEWGPDHEIPGFQWVMVVVRNCLLSDLGSWQSRTSADHLAMDETKFDEVDHIENLEPISDASYQACAGDSPMMQDLYGDELNDALDTLPELDRSIVRMKLDGYQVKEIATALEIVNGDRITPIYNAAITKICSLLRFRHGIQSSVDAVASPTRKGIIAVGAKFGYLEVLEHLGVRKQANLYRCVCSKDGCGRKVILAAGSFNRGTKCCQFHGSPGKWKG